MQARGIRFVRVDGTTKINERQATVDSFQKEVSGVDVIISSLKARKPYDGLGNQEIFVAGSSSDLG